ncbi:hypothetical protein QJV46_gp09 [Serratia phage vB_SmaS_Opt-155]|uniref:Uncharacterized protein n=1 Tax=Serratia phage vB_SmaS_Opt-155 TaxID=2902690 RepID=A0AC61TPY5_9CAUD|nr:hypothetical protein QJV46_gp09 [Serratia phage vB_SmaS_Opt-155]UGO52718.1 hypothetical protein OPT155_9 [Serratia phage vB_SmaS_Opt-155]
MTQPTPTPSNVLRFTKEKAQTDTDHVVSLLEMALAHVKEHGAHSVAIILLDKDQNLMDAWHSGQNPYAILGGLVSLQHEFMAAQIQSRFE